MASTGTATAQAQLPWSSATAGGFMRS